MIRKKSNLFATVGALAWVATSVLAQSNQPPPTTQPATSDPSANAQHSQHQPSNQPPAAGDQNKALVDQVAELRAQVARLEAALVQGHRAQPMQMAPGNQMQGMPGMGTGQQGGMDGMMGMMNQMMSGATPMGGMGMGGMSGMNQPQPGAGAMPMGPGMGMERMMGMGRMGQMPVPGMQVSTLPGFPGASHIYHVGATGFFLDHPEHITLTTEQQTRLGQLREKALMDQATAQRKIDQAEQELWDLTASDSPEAAKIEAKVREIEKLRGDQRLAFIRAVGNAATVLTDDQRKQLTGMLPPAPTPPPTLQPMQGSAGMSDHM